MREEAAANEALLIDFNATEAAKMAVGGGEATGGAGWMPPGAGPNPGWVHPGANFSPFPPGPMGAYPGYGPMDSAMSPPPPYGGYPQPPTYQTKDVKPPPASSAPPMDEKKQQPPPPSFNIPPNNLDTSGSLPSSNETSPAGNKPVNSNNLQVISPVIYKI